MPIFGAFCISAPKRYKNKVREVKSTPKKPSVAGDVPVPRVLLLYVFLFDCYAAFAVYLYACGFDDDVIYQ